MFKVRASGLGRTPTHPTTHLILHHPYYLPPCPPLVPPLSAHRASLVAPCLPAHHSSLRPHASVSSDTGAYWLYHQATSSRPTIAEPLRALSQRGTRTQYETHIASVPQLRDEPPKVISRRNTGRSRAIEKHEPPEWVSRNSQSRCTWNLDM